MVVRIFRAVRSRRDLDHTARRGWVDALIFQDNSAHAPPSRGPHAARVFKNKSLRKREGAGNAGCFSAPVAPRAKNESTQISPPQARRTFRHSLRDGVTVSSGLSLVIGLSCHHPRSRCVSIVTRLISASRYQDHTAWPSAKRTLVSRAYRVHRIPRQTLSDDRETPLF